MLIKNNLILAVLISLGLYDTIQAGTIRGVDIPKLNVTKIVGKWYLSTVEHVPSVDSQILCEIYLIEKQSEESFTNNVTFATRSSHENETPNPSISQVRLEYRIMNDSDVIMEKLINTSFETPLIIFDVDYELYMAIYRTLYIEDISNGSGGTVEIWSRHKTLPNSVIDKIRQSNFYQPKDRPDFVPQFSNHTICE